MFPILTMLILSSGVAFGVQQVLEVTNAETASSPIPLQD